MFFGVVALVGASTTAQAGVLIVSEHTAPEQEAPTVSRTFVDARRVRIESMEDGVPRVMVFRGDQDRLWVFDEAEKTYTEFSRAQMKALRQQMDGALRAFEATIADMPEAMREPTRRMVADGLKRLDGTYAASFELAEASTSFGQWECRKYVRAADGAVCEEIWVVSSDALGVESESAQALKDVSDFLSDVSPQQPVFLGFVAPGGSGGFVAQAASGSPDESGPSGPSDAGGGSSTLAASAGASESAFGIPVQSIVYEAGAPRTTVRVREVTSQAFSEDLFSIPAGYRRQSAPALTAGPVARRGAVSTRSGASNAGSVGAGPAGSASSGAASPGVTGATSVGAASAGAPGATAPGTTPAVEDSR